MKLKQFILCALMIGVFSLPSRAVGNKDATLKASSTGKANTLTIKIYQGDGAVIGAWMMLGQDSIDLIGTCEAYKVVDLPNHMFSFFFLEKPKSDDPTDPKSLAIWGIPSSFVKMPGSDYNWRFKIKAKGTLLKGEAILMDAIFEWNP